MGRIDLKVPDHRKRAIVVAFISCLSVSSLAQVPDVSIKFDVLLHYRSEKRGETTLRWYDTMGRHSTVGLVFGLEPGFRGYVSEKLQRIPNDGDPEQLDEYYVEDPGLWRVGKQYVPFGRDTLFRQSIIAARGDTNLLFEHLPVSLAICDSGRKRERGFVGRIGTALGLSFAIGEHFGIQGTALTPVRRPEDSPGQGRGYRTVVGMDFGKRVGPNWVQAEALVLRNPHNSLDQETEISDLAFTFRGKNDLSMTLAWSRNWGASEDFYRAQAHMAVGREVAIEPFLRLRRTELFDAGISVRVKL